MSALSRDIFPVEGAMSLSINGSAPKVYPNEWIVETSNASAEPFSLFTVEGIKLKEGDNKLDMQFIPDKKQHKSGYLGQKLKPGRDGSGGETDFDIYDEFLITSTAPITRSFTVTLRKLSTSETFGVNKYTVIYVAPNGKPTGNGTKDNPLDIVTAIAVSSPGQMIILRDGIYTPLDKPETVQGQQRIPVRLRIPRYNSGLPNKDTGAPSAPHPKPTKEIGSIGADSRYYFYNDPYYKYYKVIRAEQDRKSVV